MKKLSELKQKLSIERGHDLIEIIEDEMIVYKDLRVWFINIVKELRKNRSSNPDYSKQELNGIEKWIMKNVPLSEDNLK